MESDKPKKVISGLKIHTENWSTGIEEFISLCADCPYRDDPRDTSSLGCVYRLMTDALEVLIQHNEMLEDAYQRGWNSGFYGTQTMNSWCEGEEK